MRRKILLLIWIFCICISCYVSGVEATSPDNTLFSGIDVSNWQGYVDYEEVADDRYSSCVHKSNSR